MASSYDTCSDHCDNLDPCCVDCPTAIECEDCIPCDDSHCLDGVQLQPCCDEVKACCPPTCSDACDDPDCDDILLDPHYCCVPHVPAYTGYGHDFRTKELQETLCGPNCMATFHKDHHGFTIPQLPVHHCTDHSSSGIATPSSMISDIATQPNLPMAEQFHCHWESCDLSFLDSLQFDQHFLTDHLKPIHNSEILSSSNASPASLACAWDSCAVAPPSVPALFDHVKHDHVDVEKHHRCKWLVADESGNIAPCGLCVSSAEDLTRHIVDDHIGSRQKEYTCYWQDCERCQRPFSQRQKITRHIVVHTGDRPYRCNICGYACSEEAVLKQHQRTHTGERPFSCSVCHKSFSASTALSVHMRTHTGFKPLVCKFPGCGKRFSESSNLAKHQRTHSKIKPYICQEHGCNKSFQRPDQLKRHQNSVHKSPTSSLTSLV